MIIKAILIYENKNTRSIVQSPDGNAKFYSIVVGVHQENISAIPIYHIPK